MVVRDGLVLSCVPFWPAHRVACILYPVPQVVIFSAPAPEGIRKAIDFPKLFYSQAAHATKKLCVGKPEKDSARLEIQSCVSLQTRLFSYNAGVELRGSPSRARGLSITP